MTKKRAITAGALMKQLNADPEFVARRKQADEELKARVAEGARAEAPLVDRGRGSALGAHVRRGTGQSVVYLEVDRMNIEERERQRLAAIVRNRQDAEPVIAALRDAGFAVATVADLFNQKLDYRDAIPLLLAWLPRISNLNVKSSLIRALSVEWAKGSDAARMLVAEFEQAEDPGGTGLRWTIGNALEVLASDAIVDDLLRLATNRDYGRAREMVVMGLGKLKDPRVPDVLIGLLDDEAVVGHAVIALGKLRVKSARERLVSLAAHPKTWVRNAAKKAIARIDKA